MWLPLCLQEDELSLTIYSLSSISRSNAFKIKDKIDKIDITDPHTYGTDISSYEFVAKFANNQHGHLMSGDL